MCTRGFWFRYVQFSYAIHVPLGAANVNGNRSCVSVDDINVTGNRNVFLENANVNVISV